MRSVRVAVWLRLVGSSALVLVRLKVVEMPAIYSDLAGTSAIGVN